MSECRALTLPTILQSELGVLTSPQPQQKQTNLRSAYVECSPLARVRKPQTGSERQGVSLGRPASNTRSLPLDVFWLRVLSSRDAETLSTVGSSRWRRYN
ncbi:unnamed protein product [Ixodes persulcatus]